MSLNLTVRVVVLVAASVLPFARCLPNPWLWDDRVILGQRLAPAKCGGLGDVWRQPYWGLDSGPRDTYRPLSLSLIYLERQAFGDAVVPYHAVSLGLHAVASLLVMWVIGRLAGPAIGWATALLFAVHPVHAEAVAMVYGQLELVAAIFVLLAVGLYARARVDGVRPRPFALALLCAACAACSKESALMLPALLMLVRASWPIGEPGEEGRVRRFAKGLGWDALFLIAMAPYLALRFQALGGLAPDPEATISHAYTPGQWVKAVVVSVGHTLRLCTLPTGQGLYYGHLRDSVGGVPYNEASWIFIAVAVAFVLGSKLGRRPAWFGVGWFLLALFPVSNVVPTGVLVAERTLYLPALGICFLAAALLDRLARDSVISPRIARGALTGLVILGAVASAQVVASWRDEETLWRATVQAHPRSPLGQLQLGQAMLDRWSKSAIAPPPEQLREAAAAFDAAYELNPKLTQALVGSGLVAARQGDDPKAERLLRKAEQMAPGDPLAREALRQFLEQAKMLDPEA